MLTPYINSNTTLAELINAIEMDQNATSREKALIERLGEAGDEVLEKEAEIDRLEDRISDLEKENNEKEEELTTLETERDSLKDRVEELESALETLKAEA